MNSIYRAIRGRCQCMVARNFATKTSTSTSSKSSAQPDLMSTLDSINSMQGAPQTDPLTVPDFFNVASMFTMRDLFDSRVHLGHKVGLRNEYMKPYLFGERLGCDIIDLEKTQVLLREALNFTAHVVSRGGVILFVSRHGETLPAVERAASSAGEYSHCRPWAGGTFTNSSVQYGAVTRLPDLVIFSSTAGPPGGAGGDQHCAIAEAAKCNIPTVAVVDSNSDPRLVSYPVPGNDDSRQSVNLYLDLFVEAIARGKTHANKA